MTLKKYWANRHSMVGEHDSLRTTTDIPIYLACDVDTALAQARAEGRQKGLEEKDKRIESLESTLIDVQNYASQRVAELEQERNTWKQQYEAGVRLWDPVYEVVLNERDSLRAQLATLTAERDQAQAMLARQKESA